MPAATSISIPSMLSLGIGYPFVLAAAKARKSLIAIQEKALDELWPFTGELFQDPVFEQELIEQGIGADLPLIRTKWEDKVKEILTEATLGYPSGGGDQGVWMQSGGREGLHTEHLGYLLAETAE